MARDSRMVVVLGGGNTAFSLAAKLALDGQQVVLWEVPSQAETIAPIRESRQIRLSGAPGACPEGVARLAAVTTDAGEALAAADLLLAPVPSYAHRAFAEALLPHLQPRHILALLPGNLGSLAVARQLAEAGVPVGGPRGPLLVESDTAPYVCRKVGPAHAHIWGTVRSLGLGTFPSRETARALAQVGPFFPGVRAYPNALACGLSAMNPVVHPAGVLLNAGRIEYAKGEFYFYEEGVTPGVVRVIEALDAERRALGAALGLELTHVAEAFFRAGFGPQGDLWSTINGSWMLTQLRAPGSLQTRWLSEDVPYGLVTWALLAEQCGVAMPVARALVELAAAVTGADLWRLGRSPSDLNLVGLRGAALQRYLASGQQPAPPKRAGTQSRGMVRANTARRRRGGKVLPSTIHHHEPAERLARRRQPDAARHEPRGAGGS